MRDGGVAHERSMRDKIPAARGTQKRRAWHFDARHARRASPAVQFSRHAYVIKCSTIFRILSAATVLACPYFRFLGSRSLFHVAPRRDVCHRREPRPFTAGRIFSVGGLPSEQIIPPPTSKPIARTEDWYACTLYRRWLNFVPLKSGIRKVFPEKVSYGLGGSTNWVMCASTLAWERTEEPRRARSSTEAIRGEKTATFLLCASLCSPWLPFSIRKT
jgi:hypothetical protein